MQMRKESDAVLRVRALGQLKDMIGRGYNAVTMQCIIVDTVLGTGSPSSDIIMIERQTDSPSRCSGALQTSQAPSRNNCNEFMSIFGGPWTLVGI
jgi:hypothetical protein